MLLAEGRFRAPIAEFYSGQKDVMVLHRVAVAEVMSNVASRAIWSVNVVFPGWYDLASLVARIQISLKCLCVSSIPWQSLLY